LAYSISEAAEKSGINPHTLRFYDRQGLLPFMKRGQGEIRQFSELDMECLEIITTLKATGLKIKKIKEYLDLCVLGDDALEQRLQFMLNHKSEVERQMEALNKYMDVIEYKIWYYNTAITAETENVHLLNYKTTGKSSRQLYLEEKKKKEN